MIDKNIIGFEFQISKSYLPELLRKNNKISEIGIGFLYTTLGNKDVFGSLVAIYPFIKPVFIEGKKASLNGHFGVGLAYATEPFDIQNNYKNIAVSTHLNPFFNIGINYSYKISSRYSLSWAMHLRHISNGAIRKPNKGLNFLSINLGLKHLLIEKMISEVDNGAINETAENQKASSILLLGNVGFHQVNIIDTHKYLKSSFICEFIRPVRKKWFYGGGIDYFYDKGVDRSKYGGANKTFYFRSSVGAHGSIGIFLEKITIYGNLGIPIYSKSDDQNKPYSRLGIRYHLTEKFIANVGLKAYFFRADFIEFGLGYTIFTL